MSRFQDVKRLERATYRARTSRWRLNTSIITPVRGDRPVMTGAEAGATVEILGVAKRHGKVEALADVTLDVRSGECVALVGESGSGKTTLLRCINRLHDPDAGSILVNGRDNRSVSAVALRRSIGYVPQDGGILPHWTVARNVALVPTLCGMSDASLRAD